MVPFQERLKSLTDIVWPEIARLVRKEIGEADAQGNRDVKTGRSVLCCTPGPPAPGASAALSGAARVSHAQPLRFAGDLRCY